MGGVRVRGVMKWGESFQPITPVYKAEMTPSYFDSRGSVFGFPWEVILAEAENDSPNSKILSPSTGGCESTFFHYLIQPPLTVT